MRILQLLIKAVRTRNEGQPPLDSPTKDTRRRDRVRLVQARLEDLDRRLLELRDVA